MNILVFSWRGPGHPNAGGAEISTHEHTKGWVKAGHRVTLFTSYFPGGKKYEQVDGVEVIRSGRQVLGVQLEALKWYIFTSHQKFDLVIDQFHGLPFFTPLFVRAKKLAFIHEVTKEIWKYNTWTKPLNLIPSTLGPFLEPLIVKYLYTKVPFMTVSESTREDLMQWGIPRKSVTVIHNGYHHHGISTLPTKEIKETAIFLGAIAKDKGIEDALKVFSYLNKKENDWQFWVIGKADRAYLSFLKQLARIFGIAKKVKFFGYVTEKEKFTRLAKAHVLVNPSIREGWGLVVIEAASVGTPTIGYNVPGLRDSIKDGWTGILSEPNAKECSEAIIELMSDRNKYNKLKNNCIIWSKEFDWERSSKNSLNLIEKLVPNLS